MLKPMLLSFVVFAFVLLTTNDARPEGTRNLPAAAAPSAEKSTASFPHSPIIGNKDTKRYHLPGMPYYNKVKKYHRVYFESEQQAIEQGYYKAGTPKGSGASPTVSPQKAEVETAARALPETAAVAPPPQAAASAGAETRLPEKPPKEDKATPAPKAEPLKPPSTGASQPAPEKVADQTPKLSLQECLEIAFKQNRLRLVSGESIKIAEAQYQQALSGHWPQIKFSITGMRMDEEPTFVFPAQPIPLGAAGQPLAEAIALAQLAKMGITPSTPGFNTILANTTQTVMQQLAASNMPAQKIKMMDRDLLTSTLSMILPLYTGGKVSALAKQAKAGVDVSRQDARQTDLQIVRDVKQYYYGYVLSKKLHQLGRETLARFEGTEAITESVYQHGSGKVKKTDYLRSKMMTSAVRSAVEVLKSNEELARSALANVMGLSRNTPVAVADAEIPFVPYEGSLEELVSRAHLHNPQMNTVRLGLAAREGKITEARSGHLPVVAVFGNFMRLDNSYDGGVITDENRNSWQVGISMELPIFNGLRTTREVQEAKFRLEKLKQESMLLQEGVALQVKNAFLQIARSQGQVTSMKEAMAAAVENRELNVRAYAQEIVETKDVIEAQLMEFMMHGQYLKSLYDHQVNMSALEYIVGNSIYENR